MALNKNNLIDLIINILLDNNLSDDSRLDRNIISHMIDSARAQMIVADYNKYGVVRQEWLSDLGLVEFHRVNFADDPNITYCECDISKAFVPKVVSITDGSNSDVGFKTIMSACGKDKYYNYSIELWKDIPTEHPRSLFKYYYRIDTSMYVNKRVEQLRMNVILESPEDGYIISSTPVASGDLVAGTEYIVKYKQITYNFTTIAVNGTFIAQVGLPTYTGTGTVYLADQYTELSRNQPYPISRDFARDLIIDICTKEFKIAQGQMPDVLNDSADDETEAKKPATAG